MFPSYSSINKDNFTDLYLIDNLKISLSCVPNLKSIFVFVSNERDAFTWTTGTKIFYVILSILTSESMLKNLGFFKEII